jgi:hypothetical protein
MMHTSTNKIIGHVLIRDTLTDQILLDKVNAINFENFSVALAAGAAYQPEGYIHEMVFGNGAAVVSGTGTVSYLPPNVVGQNAQLYNQTYNKVINNLSPANTDPNNNFIRISHRPGTLYTDIIITCLLTTSEPAGQDAFDTATDINSPFVFNELGLKTRSAAGIDQGLLITHLVHNPVQKSLNREIEVVYTLRVQTV